MKKIILFFFFLIPFQADAYVYPSYFVYKNWVEESSKVSSLSYEKVYYEIENSNKRGTFAKKEVVYIKRPGQVRIWDEANDTEYRVGPSRAIVMKNGQTKEISMAQVLDPFELVWAFNNTDALLIRISQFYMPQEENQWFLFDGEKHWMNGKRNGSFLLFSTDPYRPKMFQYGNTIDQFIYENIETSLFPKKIIEFENKKPTYEVLIQNLQINPTLDASYFKTS